MRPLEELRQFAITLGADGGAFRIPQRKSGEALRVIASTGGGWDHVSVSHPQRIPLWMEMEHVRLLFFRPEETVMQLHVPLDDHVNHHPRCLHLWRPHGVEIPHPPKVMV